MTTMTRRAVAALLAGGGATLVAGQAFAATHQVRMLNTGANGATMVFDPPFLRVRAGDTVKFIATDRGHNAASITGMTPDGATPFNGRINQEIEVVLTVPGLYGYKCTPHTGMGMVGLIQVGAATNRAAATTAAARIPGLGKTVMAGLLGQVR
jgi:pseudoazurin